MTFTLSPSAIISPLRNKRSIVSVRIDANSKSISWTWMDESTYSETGNHCTRVKWVPMVSVGLYRSMPTTKTARGSLLAQLIMAATLFMVILFLIFADVQKFDRESIEQKELKRQQLLLQFDTNKNGVLDENELSHSKLTSF